MTIETKPLEVIDFTGGITDYFIDGPITHYEQADNLFINVNKKLITRPGSEVYHNEQLPLGVFRVNSLIFYEDDLFVFQNRRAYYVSGGTWVELEGPPSDGFFRTGVTDMVISHSPWQGHIFLSNDEYARPQKMFKDSGGTYRVRTAGMPSVPSGVIVGTPSGAGESYLYAFLLSYDYTVESVAFEDKGPVYIYPTVVTGGAITGGNTVSITLPTTLASPDNWDSTNFKVEIYRTASGGDTFYKVGETTFGTTPFVDNVTDATLQNNETLYTTGGVVSNETPPQCKFLHVVNDTGYYANILEGSEYNEYLVIQSVPGDPDSAPSEFFAETEQKIKGLSSIFDRPLVFCEDYVYRIDGFRDELGGGEMLLVRIDDNAGCMGQNSIVRTHKGIFWAGKNGFYWSDGFKVQLISKSLLKTRYPRWVSSTGRQEHITGVYDPGEDRIIWSIADDGVGVTVEPNAWVVLDLKWGIREDCTFTTCSGTQDSFHPTALAFKDKIIYRGDTRGYVLKHVEGIYTDVRIDTAVSPDDWYPLTIEHTYKSCFVDFGTKFVRKFVPRILISAANTTNLSLAISSSNDNDRVVGDLKPIRYRNNVTWGDALPLWGDTSVPWNFQGIIEEWRRFPARGLRCNYKQVQFTNAMVQIFTSSILGEVTVDSTAKTATLGGSKQWIDDVVDYYIAFENDDYENEYLITANTTTTITFEDLNNSAPSGNYDFVVRGKPKGEVLELNGYVLHWEYLSKSFKPFSSSDLGSNP
jgi:hypothetical protein